MLTATITKIVRNAGLPDILAVEVGPGKWCFHGLKFAWMFNERQPRPVYNFAMYIDGKYAYQLRVDSIEVAVMYSIGFEYGYTNGLVHGQEEVKGVEKMVEKIKKENAELRADPYCDPASRPQRSDQI
jgi:hypothetical protein